MLQPASAGSAARVGRKIVSSIMSGAKLRELSLHDISDWVGKLQHKHFFWLMRDMFQMLYSPAALFRYHVTLTRV